MEEVEALCSELAIQHRGKWRCLGSVQHVKAKYGGGYEVKLGLDVAGLRFSGLLRARREAEDLLDGAAHEDDVDVDSEGRRGSLDSGGSSSVSSIGDDHDDESSEDDLRTSSEFLTRADGALFRIQERILVEERHLIAQSFCEFHDWLARRPGGWYRFYGDGGPRRARRGSSISSSSRKSRTIRPRRSPGACSPGGGDEDERGCHVGSPSTRGLVRARAKRFSSSDSSSRSSASSSGGEKSSSSRSSSSSVESSARRLGGSRSFQFSSGEDSDPWDPESSDEEPGDQALRYTFFGSLFSWPFALIALCGGRDRHSRKRWRRRGREHNRCCCCCRFLWAGLSRLFCPTLVARLRKRREGAFSSPKETKGWCRRKICGGDRRAQFDVETLLARENANGLLSTKKRQRRPEFFSLRPSLEKALSVPRARALLQLRRSPTVSTPRIHLASSSSQRLLLSQFM